MSDYIVRGTAANDSIRAFAITSHDMVEEARSRHNTSPIVTAALGRMLSAGSMMGVMLKGEDDLVTLQIQGSGPMKGITVTANSKGEVKGFANAIWTGLTTLEYAKTIEHLLNRKAHGLFQAAPAESISKYNLIQLFEKFFPGERTIIKVDNNRVDKSLVPYWGEYDIHIKNYEQQVSEMKQWIEKHPDLYPKYYYSK